MPFINDRVLDNGLTILTSEANQLRICSAEPATFTEATSTYTLGTKTTPTVSSPTARSPGRKVTVSAISDGNCTGNGNATHWALVDTVNSQLLAASSLGATYAVTTGRVFTLAAFDIGCPGA